MSWPDQVSVRNPIRRFCCSSERAFLPSFLSLTSQRDTGHLSSWWIDAGHFYMGSKKASVNPFCGKNTSKKKKSLPVLKSGRVLPHSTHVVMSSYKDGRVFEIFVDIEYF